MSNRAMWLLVMVHNRRLVYDVTIGHWIWGRLNDFR